MITLLLALMLMTAVVFTAGRWAQNKQRRLATSVDPQRNQEVADARLDR